MVAGLAMVVTDVGGNAEAVVDGVTGLVVPAQDPPALGQAILTLAQDPATRDKMGRAARERVRRSFRWKNASENTMKYTADCSTRPPPPDRPPSAHNSNVLPASSGRSRRRSLDADTRLF